MTFEQKQSESQRLRSTYPDRVPCIVMPLQNAKSQLPALSKNKFLVPRSITLAEMTWVIRRRLVLRPHDSLFVFVTGNLLFSPTELIGNIDKTKCETDGFLYLFYAEEETFGSFFSVLEKKTKKDETTCGWNDQENGADRPHPISSDLRRDRSTGFQCHT